MSARRTLRTLILAAIASPWLADAGAAPDPREAPEAVVQVYGARAMGVKGWFAVHTWVAVKPTDATAYTVYEVIGWRLRWSDSALVVRTRQPDAPWFGSAPELYAEKRGPGVGGIEVNLLGLNFGVGPSGVKLPLLGRLGPPTGD